MFEYIQPSGSGGGGGKLGILSMQPFNEYRHFSCIRKIEKILCVSMFQTTK